MRVLSWNVNGIRAAMRKGFATWLETSGADIVGLQEVRAKHDQVAPLADTWTGWHTAFVSAEKAGYSGVGLLSKTPPDEVEISLDCPEYDVEGRYVRARYGKLIVVSAYFPKGDGRDRSNSRVPYKLGFYRRLYERLEEDKQRGAPILVMGDFNTAHQELDLARPKQNAKTSGFLPEERAEIDRWIAGGWVDTFREYHKGGGHYSWWYQAFNARERNVGWRIDYVFASRAACALIKNAFILPDVFGSDHCPVGVDIDLTQLKKLRRAASQSAQKCSPSLPKTRRSSSKAIRKARQAPQS